MMIPRKLYYMLHSGKNSKLRYYITSYLWILTPHCLLSLFRKMVLSKVSQRDDWEEISQRVDYYNSFNVQPSTILPFNSRPSASQSKRKQDNRFTILTHFAMQRPFL